MIVLVIVLAVIAVAALVATLVTRSRLGAQRVAAASASATAAQTAAERDAEQARATAAEAARDDAAARAEAAATQAAEADRKAADAETRAATADAHAAAAEARAAEADTLAAEAAARNGLDPDVVWTLERARSERTWRQSVALGTESASLFDGAEHPLREALQVELDAAREDVGAIIDLDTDVPPSVTAAGSMLVLRAAQELLARSVKQAEQTTLHVLTDGADVLVTVEATDEHGTPVAIEALAVPASADLEATDGGVRIKRALPA